MNAPSSKDQKRRRFQYSIAHLLALTGVVALHVAFPSLWLVWITLFIALVLALFVASLETVTESLELSYKKLLSTFAILLMVIFCAALWVAYR